jgi:UDP-glucose 4-epimerase
MIKAWVLGSHGLLGSALCRALRQHDTELFIPTERFAWHDANKLSIQIGAAVKAFSASLEAADQWEIYWAAGIGTMGSSAEAFAPETEALSTLINALKAESRLMTSAGAMAFASSAGAIYASCRDDVITENSTPAPSTDYARQKLKHEDIVRSIVTPGQPTRALIARISTLYGPGQAAGKKQGLMTHIARCILRNQPIQIYVPYDTIRDYITADDAAAMMIATVRATDERTPLLTKIVASERPATIAEIVSIFKRVTRRAPLVVTSASRLSSLYSRRVQFRSIVANGHTNTTSTTLMIGIARLMAAERAAFTRNQISGLTR